MRTISLAVPALATMLTLGSLTLTASGDTNVWTGAGGDKLWSNASNWAGAVPDATNDAVFIDTDASGTAGPAGTSNNVVDAGAQARTLLYRNTNGFHHTHIPAGATLAVGAALNTSANVLYVGLSNSGANSNMYVTVAGPGTLLVSNPANATIQVSQRGASAGSHRATLDLSGLNLFVADVSRLAVASDGSTSPLNYPCGTLLLARTNDITCSDAGAGTSILVASTSQNEGQPSLLRLGQVNTFKADGGMKIGANKSSAVLDFNTGLTNPTAVFRNKAGTGAMAYWGIGDNSGQSSNSGINHDGKADFTAGTVDALVGSLYVGRSLNANTGTALSVGTLAFASGTISASSVEVGSQRVSGQARAMGRLNVGTGGTLQVSGNVTLGVLLGGTGSATGTLNAGGGAVSIGGSLLDGGGTSVINLTNAALTVSGALGTGTSPVDVAGLSDSTLGFYLSGGTNAVVTSLATGGATNRITVLQLPDIISYPAQFTVIKYAGAIGGNGFNFGLGNAAGFPAYLVDNAGNASVDIVITAAVASAAITWVGGLSTNWDAGVTANWKDGGGSPVVFQQLDAAYFDDSASNFSVNLVSSLVPSALTVNNASSNYAFVGTGRITGSGGLTKQGGATLTLANTGLNNFTGPIALDGGTLAIVREDSHSLTNTLSGGGHLHKIGSGTTTLSGTSTGFLGAVTIGGGTLQVGAGGTSGQVQGNVTNQGTLVFSRSDPVTYGGSISGTGAVTKQSGNSLTLTGASSYGGPTLVAGGILRVQNGAGLGNSSGVTVNNGTTLRLEGGVSVTNIPLTLVNGGIDTQGPLQGANGTNTWTGPITINANQLRIGAISNSTLVLGGAVGSGTNLFGLAVRCQETGGTLVLAASNTWLGASSIVVGSARLADGDHRIPVSTSLTLGNSANVSGAFLDLAGWNQQLAGLASLGTVMPVGVTNTTPTLSTLTLAFDGSTLTNRGPIGGPIALVKAGTGVQVLSGTNTYDGDTTVSAGTLQLGAPNVLPDGAGKGNFAVDGTLNLAGLSEAINGLSGTGRVDNLTGAGANTFTIGYNNAGGTFNGVIANTAGTLSLVKAGSGTITLGGVNTYAGTTTLAEGTLALGAGGSIDASTGLTIAGGAVLDASVPGAVQLGAGEPLLAGRTNAFANDILGSLTTAGSIDVGGALKAATLTISGGLALTNSSIALDLGSAATPGAGVNDLIVLNGPLGLGGISVITPTFYGTPGTGTYTLVSGGTSLTGDGSNLQLVWPSNLLRQTASLDVLSSPGNVLLLVAGAPASLVWAGTNNSLWDIGTSANWNNLGSPDLFFNYDSVWFDDSSTNGAVDVAAAVAPTAAVISNGALAYAFNGPGKITGNATVLKTGPGVATLSLTNDYTGPTFVTAGVLRVGRTQALGATNGGTFVTQGGTLDLSSNFIEGEPVIISGSGLTNQGALVNNIPSFTANYGLRFLTLAGDAWLGGSGRYDIKNAPTVLGNGYTLNKVGTNTVNFVDALNANFGAVNVSNGMVQFQGATTLGPPASPITVVAPGVLGYFDATATNAQPTSFTGGRLWVRNGSASMSGPISLAGSVDVRVDSVALHLHGPIGGSGGFAKNGTGTLNLYAASNTWSGGAALNAGAVNVYETEALAGAVTNNTVLAFLPGTGGIFGCSAVITGTGNLIKDGAGTLVLAGANGYSGTTDVSNGLLLVNGTVGTGAVAVGATATLGGTGMIGGPVVNNGTVSPGASIGTLSLGGTYSQSPGSVYRMEIGGAGAGGVAYDLLQASGQAALDGTLQVALTNGFSPVAGNTFTVLTASAVSGAFAAADLPVLDGATWQITTNAGSLLLGVVSGASPYADWAALHGLGPGSETGDADNDGYNNLLEYSQFSDPTNSASTAAMGGKRSAGNALQLLFFRNTDAVDLTYIVEAANAVTNQADWQAINANVHGLGWSDPANASETGAGNPRSVTVTDPVAGATNRYLRLRVTKP